MEQTLGRGQGAPWALTAPESYALLHGPTASGVEAFKLALLELVARGHLSLTQTETRSSFGDVAPVSVLARLDTPAPPSEPVLASVWTLYNSIPPRVFVDGTEGVAVDELARESQRRYRPLNQFTERIVFSMLLDRALYAYETRRVFWVIPARRLSLTQAGAAARADLEGLLALGDAHLAEWVDRDPDRALAYSVLAGPALLLLTELFPALGRLPQNRRLLATAGCFETPIDHVLSPRRRARLDQAFAAIDSAVDSSSGVGG